MTEVVNTVVCPIIRQDMVLPMLKSLKANTEANYKTIVVNQTQPDPEFEKELYASADLVIRTHLNYGFAQSSDLGLRLAPTPYITVCNDDVLFLSKIWWSGVLETFERFPTAAAVNPQSPKEPGWGWGEPGYRYLIPQALLTSRLCQLVAADRQRMAAVKEAKKAYEIGRTPELQKAHQDAWLSFRESQSKLEQVVMELFRDPKFQAALVQERNWQVVDAFACWCTVFKADKLAEIGLFDERFFPGGGEDYCWQHRCYKAGYRALSTSRSWVWHWWGQSKDSASGFNTALPPARKQWNKLSTKGFGKDGLYDPDCGVWGAGERTDPVVYRAPL